MATKPATYDGTIPVDQPTLGLHWEPGQTQEVDAELADRWSSDPQSDFSEPGSKDAQEAKAAAASAPPPPAEAQQQPAPAPAPAPPQ